MAFADEPVCSTMMHGRGAADRNGAIAAARVPGRIPNFPLIMLKINKFYLVARSLQYPVRGPLEAQWNDRNTKPASVREKEKCTAGSSTV